MLLICVCIGATLGCTIWDVIDGRQFPESLLYPDDHPVMRYPMQPFIFNNDYDEDEDYFLDLHAHHVSANGNCSSLQHAGSLIHHRLSSSFSPCIIVGNA